jgi:hypothetical protein
VSASDHDRALRICQRDHHLAELGHPDWVRVVLYPTEGRELCPGCALYLLVVRS